MNCISPPPAEWKDPMKILLVEDEEMLNNITAKYLRAESMTVDSCFDGQQALDYISTSSYDVIVMDIMMAIQRQYCY